MAQPVINVIFMAHLPYPKGMAGTRLLSNLMAGLKTGGAQVRMLILRQGRDFHDNVPSGQHEGIEYHTLGAKIRPGWSAIFRIPGYFLEGLGFLKRWWKTHSTNVLFVYEHPSIDNLLFTIYARFLGYRVLYYLAEDIRVQAHAKDFFARIKHASAKLLTRHIGWLADAVLVISRRLKQQIESVVHERCPVELLPICVNFATMPQRFGPMDEPVRMFYGGTFGEKDNFDLLLEAFERLCDMGHNLRLILTGQGDEQRMKQVDERIRISSFRDRIEHRGYLSQAEYSQLVPQSDILCMTRSSSAFAQAGFPFKLGEYLASGRPVIASRVSDVADYLTDRKDSILIQPDRVTEIIEAVEYLLRNPEQAESIGREGYQTARRFFDLNRQTPILLNLIQGIQTDDRRQGKDHE